MAAAEPSAPAPRGRAFHVACRLTGRHICYCAGGVPQLTPNAAAAERYFQQAAKLWSVWQQQQGQREERQAETAQRPVPPEPDVVYQQHAGVHVMVPCLLRQVVKRKQGSARQNLAAAQRALKLAARSAEAAAAKAVKAAALAGVDYTPPADVPVNLGKQGMPEKVDVEALRKQVEDFEVQGEQRRADMAAYEHALERYEAAVEAHAKKVREYEARPAAVMAARQRAEQQRAAYLRYQDARMQAEEAVAMQAEGGARFHAVHEIKRTSSAVQQQQQQQQQPGRGPKAKAKSTMVHKPHKPVAQQQEPFAARSPPAQPLSPRADAPPSVDPSIFPPSQPSHNADGRKLKGKLSSATPPVGRKGKPQPAPDAPLRVDGPLSKVPSMGKHEAINNSLQQALVPFEHAEAAVGAPSGPPATVGAAAAADGAGDAAEFEAMAALRPLTRPPNEKSMLKPSDVRPSLAGRWLWVLWDEGEGGKQWWPAKVTRLHGRGGLVDLDYATGDQETELDLGALVRAGEVAWLHHPALKAPAAQQPRGPPAGPARSGAGGPTQPSSSGTTLSIKLANPLGKKRKQEGALQGGEQKRQRQEMPGDAMFARPTKHMPGPGLIGNVRPSMQSGGDATSAAGSKPGMSAILALGVRAVGRSISVFRIKHGKWYRATVRQCASHQGRLLVQYDDGRQQTLESRDEHHKFKIRLTNV